MPVLANIDVGVAGIVVGGLATVGVAVITAVTTNRRQRESLIHDRELFDLADLRRLLDEAAVALDRAGRVREDVELAFASSGFAVAGEKREALEGQFDRLGEINSRLNLRLGVEDPIAVHFEEANDALYLILECLDGREGDDAEAIGESRRKILEYGAKSAGHSGGFVSAAVERAGTIRRPGESGDIAVEVERRVELIMEVTRLASPLRERSARTEGDRAG
jgi:hypothetical protein